MVAEGSVLDLNFLNLYVNGERVTPGSGEFGPGLIVIPEPSTSLFLLLAAAGLLIGRVQSRCAPR